MGKKPENKGLAGLRLAAALGPAGWGLAFAAALAARIPAPGGDAWGFAAGAGWYALQAGVAAPFLAVLVVLLAARVRGERPRAVRLAGAAAGAWRLWIAGLVYALAVAVGLVCLLVPGVLISIALVLYAPAAVLGGTGPLRALVLGYARARRDWGAIARAIAGPYVFYGVVIAVSVGPGVLAAARLLAQALSASAQGTALPGLAPLAHAVFVAPAPAWFAWGVMPVLSACAQLYLFAGVTSAWLALAPEPA